MANGQGNLEGALAAFEAAHKTEGQALRDMLDNTPALKARVQQAVDADQLSGFGAHPNEGAGSYSAQAGTILLPMDLLKKAEMTKLYNDAGNTARIVLGHEIGHALNKADIQATNKAFADTIETIAASPSPHDYTDALRTRGAVQRVRESKDEIAGINVLVDFVTSKKPDATLKDIYDASREMRSYIEKTGIKPVYTAKQGLTFGPDLKIAETPANVEAMGKLFYDARGYPQSYGAVSLGLIAKAEAKAQAANPTDPAPVVQADLASLGIDASKLPKHALPAGFADTSQRMNSPALANDPAHPDHAAFNRIHAWVRGTGQWDEEKSLNVAAALYREQADSPLVRRVDQVTGGLGRDGAQNVFAVYAPHGDKGPFFRAQVDGREAALQPAQQSLQQAEQIGQQYAQAQAMQQQQDLQQAKAGPALVR